MPAVIIKMLVASDPGKIQLLPALPAAWPSGRIEGVLCRGAIEIENLQWENGRVHVTMRSAKSQTVVLQLPSDITQLSVTAGTAKVSRADRANQRKVELPGGQVVTLELALK
jgi:alpha-L-fucosidase 2